MTPDDAALVDPPTMTSSPASGPPPQRDSEFTDPPVRSPDRHGLGVPPTLRVRVPDPLAAMRTRVRRRDPVQHRRLLEQLYVPGWVTTATALQQIEKQRTPVCLPPPDSSAQVKISGGGWNGILVPLLHLDPGSQKSSCNPFSLCVSSVSQLGEDAASPPQEEDGPRLLRFPAFAVFRMWKPFFFWRTNVHKKKFHRARESLRSCSFIVSQSLSPALLDIRKLCYQMSEAGLCPPEDRHPHTLQDYRDTRFRQLTQALTDLENFQDLVKQVVGAACRAYLMERCRGGGSEDQERWRIVAQIETVVHCNRLSCFLRLVDYLLVETLHSLVVSAVENLLAALQDPVHQTRQPETDAAQEDLQKKADVARVPPLFVTRLLLDGDAFAYRPSEENFQDAMADILLQFEKTVTSVNLLAADPEADFMTKPGLSETFEFKYEGGPCLESVLSNDGRLQSLAQDIKESVRLAFDSARVHSRSLERFRTFYRENRKLDPDAVRRRDHGVSFFGGALHRYHQQRREASALQQDVCLGLLLVDQSQLRETLVSSPLRCLEVINETLPLLAKARVDAVVSEAREAEFQLKSRPSTTAELSDSLCFLDNIQERVTALEEEQEEACQLYHLVDAYSVPTPPEDLVVFATVRSDLISLQDAIAEAELQRDAVAERLLSSLDGDAKQLIADITAVRLRSPDPRVLDASADPALVRQVLEETRASVEELQMRASTCNAYQEKLKVEPTRFEGLEEVRSASRLTRLLWDVMDEWRRLQEGWRRIRLDQLDLDQVGSQVSRYCEHLQQLENGLPPNDIVPRLKDQLDVMRRRLPVLKDLCNPCMRASHWRTLESTIGTTLNMEELTLAALEEINVFSFHQEIQEASGEASVETLLTKMR
ncbi:dynein axonemal heavy chain 6-like isoform X2 [Antennarius striatus]|uniref:dynein axonemal heavy chain 6-like isoform X2 n=1 Tax=Antennarius striatus TaxID=241820 RepID=UPI0035B261AC